MPESWRGLCGEELKTAVGRECSPRRVLDVYTGEQSVWEVLRGCDYDQHGDILNRFSFTTLPWGAVGFVPPTANLVNVVNADWWKLDAPYGSMPALDLFNRFPCLTEVIAAKASYPPGKVDEAADGMSFERWKVGRGVLEQETTIVWEIDDEFKGDVARTVMYLIAVYPKGLRTAGPMTNFLGFGSWKGFTESAARLMMAWSDADPVSDVERRRNDTFDAAQGNRNPFVDFPQLAPHIWGSEADKGIGEGDSEPPTDNSPLRGRYHLSDTVINLCSPYVAADARWQIDGKEVEGATLSPSELGVGMYKLSYQSESSRGTVWIAIEE